MQATVEIAGGILHVSDGPVRDIQRQRYPVWISVAEKNERIDRLGRTVNINRQGLLIIIPRSYRQIKKDGFPECVSGDQFLSEMLIADGDYILLKAAQNAGGVKVTDSVDFGGFAVAPGQRRRVGDWQCIIITRYHRTEGRVVTVWNVA